MTESNDCPLCVTPVTPERICPCGMFIHNYHLAIQVVEFHHIPHHEIVQRRKTWHKECFLEALEKGENVAP